MADVIKVDVHVMDDQGLNLRTYVRQRAAESAGDTLRRAARELTTQAHMLDTAPDPMTDAEWDALGAKPVVAPRSRFVRDGWVSAAIVVLLYILICASPYLAEIVARPTSTGLSTGQPAAAARR